nr:hypothetical protein 15 [bacterium]
MGSVTDQWSLIEGALNKKLVDELGSTYTVILENQVDEDGTAFEVDVDDVHVEGTFLPAETQVIEVGDNGKQRAIGIYQVTIRGPLFQGKYAMNEARDLVVEKFDRGVLLTNGTQNVRIRRASPGPSFRSGNFYEMPVTISWHSDM